MRGRSGSSARNRSRRSPSTSNDADLAVASCCALPPDGALGGTRQQRPRRMLSASERSDLGDELDDAACSAAGGIQIRVIDRHTASSASTVPQNRHGDLGELLPGKPACGRETSPGAPHAAKSLCARTSRSMCNHQRDACATMCSTAMGRSRGSADTWSAERAIPGQLPSGRSRLRGRGDHGARALPSRPGSERSRSRSGCGARSPVRPAARRSPYSPPRHSATDPSAWHPRARPRTAGPPGQRCHAPRNRSEQHRTVGAVHERKPGSRQRSAHSAVERVDHLQQCPLVEQARAGGALRTGPGRTRSGSMAASGPNTAASPAARNA